MQNTNWKRERIDVNKIMLDPKNPRLPEALPSTTQRELIIALLRHEKVDVIAKNIADYGFSPVELVVVIKIKKQIIVVEGNRRVTALKLLMEPALAPVALFKKYDALSKRANLPSKYQIECLVAPDRDSVIHLQRNRHTKSMLLPWKPLMKARFYSNLIEQGRSVKELKSDFGITIGELRESLRMNTIYKLACDYAELSDTDSEILFNPRDFPIRVLDRLLDSEPFLDFFHIEWISDSELLLKVDPVEFRSAITELLRRIINKEIDTRRLNTKRDIEVYLLNEFADYLPTVNSNSEVIYDGLRNLAESKKEDIRKAAKKRRRQKVATLRFFPEDLEIETKNPKLSELAEEFKSIDLKMHANIAGIGLRGLLDMSLSHFLSTVGEMSRLEKAMKDKNNRLRNSKWYPSIQDKLMWIVKMEDLFPDEKNMKDVLKRLAQSKDTLISVETLHLWVHNEHEPPDEGDLLKFSKQLHRFFTIILNESKWGPVS